ncbi:hypothetical protein BJV77DRAFT_963381 [Russula vinacea]|nr:hypothetical protein BJV77DRAFT_963381 [Russula vinacea]
MALAKLLYTFSLALLLYGQSEALENHNSSGLLYTCNQIAAAISGASQVFFPRSAEDVSEILRILGSTRTPFAVKGGGHATNPGFSSTTGVQISMTRFNETNVNSTCYSSLTSQYGLAVDNVAGYELVLPNGTIKDVTSNDRDLWFGLRGIVTKFILKSHPQGEAWNDTKSEVIVALTYTSGQFLISVAYFYDAPTPSGGNVSTRSFADVFQSWAPLVETNGLRVPQYPVSPAVFDAFVNQIKVWGPRLSALDKNVTLGTGLEPYDNGMFSHGSDSAYPPDRSHAMFPTVLIAVWSNSSLDETMAFALRNISNTIHAVALTMGRMFTCSGLCQLRASWHTARGHLWWNVERLRQIKAAIDPEDVMGLAGGWKF